MDDLLHDRELNWFFGCTMPTKLFSLLIVVGKSRWWWDGQVDMGYLKVVRIARRLGCVRTEKQAMRAKGFPWYILYVW
jgi:hypothetical protein